MGDISTSKIRKAARALGYEGHELTNFVNEVMTGEAKRTRALVNERIEFHILATAPADVIETGRSLDKRESKSPQYEGTNPFVNVTARDWLAAAKWASLPPTFQHHCILVGDGPFEAVDFARFLQRYKIDSSVKGIRFQSLSSGYKMLNTNWLQESLG